MIRMFTRSDFYVLSGEVAWDAIGPRIISRQIGDTCFMPFYTIAGGLVGSLNSPNIWAGTIGATNSDTRAYILLDTGDLHQEVLSSTEFRGHRLFWTKNENGFSVYAIWLDGSDVMAYRIPVGGGISGSEFVLYSHVNALWDVATIPRKSDPSKVLVMLAIQDSNGVERIVTLDGATFSEVCSIDVSAGGSGARRIIRLYGDTIMSVIQGCDFATVTDSRPNCDRYVYGYRILSDDTCDFVIANAMKTFGPLTTDGSVSRGFGGYRSTAIMDGGSEYYGEDYVEHVSRPEDSASILIRPTYDNVMYGPWSVVLRRYMVGLGGPCGSEDPKPLLALVYGSDIVVEAIVDRYVSPMEIYIIGEYLDTSQIQIRVHDNETGESVEYQRLQNRFFNPGAPIFGKNLRLRITMQNAWKTDAKITGVLVHFPTADNLIYLE